MNNYNPISDKTFPFKLKKEREKKKGVNSVQIIVINTQSAVVEWYRPTYSEPNAGHLITSLEI